MTRAYADRQVVATFMAAGSKRLKLPEPEEARERLDRQLRAEPKVRSREDDEWRTAMGLI
jgi:hypothetical protein